MFRGMLTTIKFLSNSPLLLSPLLTLVLISLFAPTGRALALVESDLLTSYKIFDFSWNDASDSFEETKFASVSCVNMTYGLSSKSCGSSAL